MIPMTTALVAFHVCLRKEGGQAGFATVVITARRGAEGITVMEPECGSWNEFLFLFESDDRFYGWLWVGTDPERAEMGRKIV
jgi:hypothetical protein